jgi:glycosyltransferase involved in cell wall biosynthesis
MFSSSQAPLISVIVTTKNRITLLPRAIASILNQDWPSIELVVVDDGSDVPVVLPTSDTRARIIRNEVSAGLPEARNIGFRACKGEFFCMLDDDDWYLPGKLSTQARYLMEHPDVDLVFSRVVVRDGAGKERKYLEDGHLHTPEINLMAFNVIHPSSVMFRRGVFDMVQFEPKIRKFEDTLFFNRLCFTVKTAYLPVDVSIWMQDGRPDQLTRVFFDRNFINFKIVCQGLDDILQRYPKARRLYYSRLAFQALRCRLFGEAFEAARKALFASGRNQSNQTDLGFSA